jgi:hypothetical protein
LLAPPTDETYHQWTIGPTYYATLVVAETFGHSTTAQIVDLNANDGYEFTPAYAVYDGGMLDKLVLFNYITDPSGANDYKVTFSVGGGSTGTPSAMPASVQVKCVFCSLFLLFVVHVHDD